MSYTVMANPITTGTRRLHALGSYGIWGVPMTLGSAPDYSTLSELQDAGWDPARLQILVQLGVSNEQLLTLPYPATDDEMTTAYNALALQLSQSQATPAAPPPAPTVTPPPSGNVVRAGTQLSYTATWGRGNVATQKVNWNDPNGIQSAIQAVLANQWGIIIDSQFHTTSDYLPNFTGVSGFTLQVHTNRDYGAPGDIKSIIDSALYNLGLPLQSSTIAITVTGTTPVITGAAPPGATPSAIADLFQPGSSSNWSAWLQQNAPFLVAALAAIVIVPPLLRRR